MRAHGAVNVGVNEMNWRSVLALVLTGISCLRCFKYGKKSFRSSSMASWDSVDLRLYG